MGRAGPSVFSIPSGAPFAQSLSQGIIDRVGRDPLALADVTILVPTRRAARTLHEAFAHALSGASLGPRIRALGDLGDEEILFDPSVDDLSLPPAVAPLRRNLLLATLVQRWGEAKGMHAPFAQSVAHAGELARFLDDATTQDADLSRLHDLAPAALAAHWQDVAAFLAIVAEQWPVLLAAEGAMEPAARRDAILRAYAARLAASPPKAPVFAAGSTGSIPATAELLKTVAHLPSGAVVLPALDEHLDASSWAALEPAHAQFGLRHLLRHIGAERDDVARWPGATVQPPLACRAHFLSEAMRPPPTTDAWRDLVERADHGLGRALDGFALVEAANPREEALAIAVAMREALETPGRTAALVTPDRGLGRRVAAELSRWNIAIDDSAGTKLSRTAPGAFLALLAHAAASRFAPVPLLALLKHPLAAGGEERAAFRRNVRALERKVLRGLRPEPGLNGISAALSRKSSTAPLQDWFANLESRFAPFADAILAAPANLAELARAHADAAEKLAADDNKSGAEHLWRGDAGSAANALIAELLEHGVDISLRRAEHYADLFRDLAEGRVVRPAYGRHPRLAILGPLEARLQHFDLTILGGLNEGVWPADAATDPWLSRPMREALGLESPERRIGLAAHDFVTLAGAPDVLLTRALKQDGAPTNASRWLLRIKQLARGLGLDAKLQTRAYLLDWARDIDAGPRAVRAARPAPRPPVAVRPRTMRVTEIETWLRDPYAIYARHVLKLKPLDAIDVEPGPRERGVAIHAALEHFLREFSDGLPADALEKMIRFGDRAFAEVGASQALLALWRPRFLRAARWFLGFETERRKTIARAFVEQKGKLVFEGPGGAFTLTGRADRIDLFADGSAAILDYKTGRAPSQKQIEKDHAPQLPLEAAMLMRGGFPDVRAATVRELLHIRLSGGEEAGKDIPFKGDATAKAFEALKKLTDLVARYDAATYPYRSRAFVERVTDTGDYDHLARVREWILAAEDDS